MRTRWLWLLPLCSCAAVHPPTSVRVCATTPCEQAQAMPLFWAGDQPPSGTQELAEVEVTASELASPGFGEPTRDQLLEALARKAKRIGADALTRVQVEEPIPGHQLEASSAMTQLSPPQAQGFARGMAVRRNEAQPPISQGTAKAEPGL